MNKSDIGLNGEGTLLWRGYQMPDYEEAKRLLSNDTARHKMKWNETSKWFCLVFQMVDY